MAGKDAGLHSNATQLHTTISLAFLIVGTLACLLHGLAAPALGQSKRAPTERKSVRSPQAKKGSKKATASRPVVVAVVNRQQITRKQLATECIRRFGPEVLESEVNKHLILQACEKQGVKITAAHVETEVQRMAAKFGFSVDRWMKMLFSERNISPGQYRRDIVWPTLALRRLAASRTEVTKDELKKAFESELGRGVQVRLIVSRSRERADEILALAKANPSQFDRLAKDKSEDENSAATRGLIPPIRRHVGDPVIEKAAFALQPGEISPVIEAAGQFLILKCERHIPPQQLTEEQRKQAEADLREALRDRKLRVAATGMFRELQAKAKLKNVYNDPELRKELPGVAAVINGRQITMKYLGEQCISRHGEAVLDGEINRALLTQAMKRRSLQVTEAELQAEIARAAETYGFVRSDGKVDVDGWLKKVTSDEKVNVDTYVRDAVWPSVALKKLVGTSVKISQEDLKKGFAANYGARVEVLAVVVSSQRTAHEVFDLARENKSEKFFGELAHQYSIEPVSRANFGQVPPIRRFGGQPMLEEEAFKLKPGETSGVLAVGDKFIILRCLGRTQPVVAEMAVVRDELAKDIREKKVRIAMTREFDRMKEKSQIDNFLAKTSQSGSESQRVSYDQSAGPVREAARKAKSGPTRTK